MDFGRKTTASAAPTKYKVNSPMQKKNKTKKVIRVKNICLVLVMSVVAAGL